MPDDPTADRSRDRLNALLVVCVLAIASLVIAVLGATPARVSAAELLGAAREPGQAAFVAGHRGDSSNAPENTLPAIIGAIEGGFDYVEVDVALTADREPVLMHDPTVDRTTNGHGPLADLTLAQVQALDAGSWFDPAFTGTRVPTLSQFLATLAASSKRGLVELKGEWDAASVAAFAGAVAAHRLERRIAVSSFDGRTLALMAGASAVIQRIAIFKTLPDDVVTAVRELDVSGIIAARKAVAAQPEVIEALHDEGKRVIVYTLNTHGRWLQAIALGVDGIITDKPRDLTVWLEGTAGDRSG